MPSPRRAENWVAGLAAAALLLGSPARAVADTVLRARLNADILSNDPGGRRDDNTDAVLMHVVEGLVAYREDLSVGPLLADHWDISKDGRVYIFHLRQGVQFHNGQPLTAADVVWSIRRYLNPKTHWRCLSEFDGGVAKILQVQAIDPETVQINLDRASPGFLSSLARPDCGETAILHPSSVAPDGSWLRPVGTGPFRLETWIHGQYVELARFPAYRPLPGPRDGNTGGKLALVDRVRFLTVPDNAVAQAAVLSGQLDIVDGLSPLEIHQLQSRTEVRLDIHPTMDLYALLFQTRDPLLKDPRLRQAIAATIDVRGLARALTLGTSPPNRSAIPVSSRFYDAVQGNIPPANLDLARQLAKAAGYHGQTIRLATNHRYPQMFDMAVLVQAMARPAGINIEIETLDWASQLAHYNSGSYQALAFGFSARLDPSLSFEVLIGNKATEPRKVWDSPEARTLLSASRIAADPTERKAIFDKLQRLFLEEAPAVALFNSPRIAAVRSNVSGYQGWPAAQQRLWGVGKT